MGIYVKHPDTGELVKVAGAPEGGGLVDTVDGVEPDAGTKNISLFRTVTQADIDAMTADPDLMVPGVKYVVRDDSPTDIQGMIEAAILAADERKHPVGVLEFNVHGANPASYLGFGTWVRWGEGRVPVSIDGNDPDFDAAQKTGGSKVPANLSTTIQIAGSDVMWNHTETGSRPGINLSGSYSNNWGEDGYDLATRPAGNQTNGNLPPYITCYMFKRTA